jgi:uncharacterized protein (TIGR03067 family)
MKMFSVTMALLWFVLSRSVVDYTLQKHGPPGDEMAIQGRWQITKIEKAGATKPPPGDTPIHIVFKDKNLIIMRGKPGAEKEDASDTFTLDETKDPKHIDVAEKNGGKWLGIYKIEGEDLTICWGAPSTVSRTKEGRPTWVTSVAEFCH